MLTSLFFSVSISQIKDFFFVAVVFYVSRSWWVYLSKLLFLTVLLLIGVLNTIQPLCNLDSMSIDI